MKKQNTTPRTSLKDTRTLTITAMFVALNVTLDLLNLRIQLTPDLRITFGFLANAMVGMLFGAKIAMVAAGISDVLGWVVNTGGFAYFPGFTITAVLAGAVWGFFFYKQSPSFLRCFFARLTVSLALNLGLNSLWKMIFFGKGYTIASFTLAIWKNALLLIPETLLLLLMLKIIQKIAPSILKSKA